MTNSIVLAHKEKHVGILTLNNPNKCNVINPDLIVAFQSHFHTLQSDTDIHVILIHGAGKHFCAGADLQHMKKMATASESENERDALWLTQLFQLINTCEKPTIAYAHGHTFGGGLGLLAASDIVIADTQAKFCFPEVKIGLLPATIAPFVVRRIGYQFAKYHMLLSDMFDAETALKIGLIDQIAETSASFDDAKALALSISQHDLRALSATKQWLQTLHPLDKTQIETGAQLLAHARTLALVSKT